MNMMEKGLRWLSGKQRQHLSSRVLYYRGTRCYVIFSTPGKTEYDFTDEYGVRVTAHSIDFLIPASTLPLVPEAGDRIVCENRTYMVLELSPQGCWRWCDPHAITRRVHTKQIQESE